MNAGPEGIPQLKERLSDLFDRVRDPKSGKPYSNEAVAEQLRERGVSVTGTYLAQLRGGRKDNPSAKLLAGIAGFFGVNIDYFFDQDTADRVVGQLDTLNEARTAQLRSLLMRADEISDEGLTYVTSVVNQIMELERQRGNSGERTS